MTPRAFLLLISTLWIQVVYTSMLRQFLSNGRSAVRSGSGRIVICIGNEAADADSIVSSLCFGYLKQVSAKESTPVVPIVSIPRNVLKLRPETEILLRMVDLDLDDLICMEDFDLKALSKEDKIEGLILTDHNSLSKRIAALFDPKYPHGPLVTEIVDHHTDSGDYPHVRGEGARNIAFDPATGRATAGSACTLVAESLLANKGAFSSDELEALGTLLAGVIMIDTQNMATTGAGTDRDAAMLTALLEAPDFLLASSSSDDRATTTNRDNENEKRKKKKIGIDRDATAARLRNAKTDPLFWHSLSARQCLVIDYKQFTASGGGGGRADHAFGMATVACPVLEFTAKPRAGAVVASFLADPSREEEKEEKEEEEESSASPSLELLAVMGSFIHPEKGYQRELLLVSSSLQRMESVEQYLLHTDPVLALVPLPESAAAETTLGDGDGDGDGGGGSQYPPGGDDGRSRRLFARCYSQTNLKASRKQVAPLLTTYFEKS
jgi:exopolyphosphatase